MIELALIVAASTLAAGLAGALALRLLPSVSARLAGLSLRERWSDWHRAPFTSESPSHISVWVKPGRG